MSSLNVSSDNSRVPSNGEQLRRSLVRVFERTELPEQGHVTAVQPDTDLAAQQSSIPELQRDTLMEAPRDAADRHSTEDRDVQDDGNTDSQVHGIIGDDDLVKLEVSVGRRDVSVRRTSRGPMLIL